MGLDLLPVLLEVALIDAGVGALTQLVAVHVEVLVIEVMLLGLSELLFHLRAQFLNHLVPALLQLELFAHFLEP